VADSIDGSKWEESGEFRLTYDVDADVLIGLRGGGGGDVRDVGVRREVGDGVALGKGLNELR